MWGRHLFSLHPVTKVIVLCWENVWCSVCLKVIVVRKSKQKVERQNRLTHYILVDSFTGIGWTSQFIIPSLNKVVEGI